MKKSIKNILNTIYLINDINSNYEQNEVRIKKIKTLISSTFKSEYRNASPLMKTRTYTHELLIICSFRNIFNSFLNILASSKNG